MSEQRRAAGREGGSGTVQRTGRGRGDVQGRGSEELGEARKRSSPSRVRVPATLPPLRESSFDDALRGDPSATIARHCGG
jgi:hypothetical protein